MRPCCHWPQPLESKEASSTLWVSRARSSRQPALPSLSLPTSPLAPCSLPSSPQEPGSQEAFQNMPQPEPMCFLDPKDPCTILSPPQTTSPRPGPGTREMPITMLKRMKERSLQALPPLQPSPASWTTDTAPGPLRTKVTSSDSPLHRSAHTLGCLPCLEREH
ncbi:proteoglycan 4-like isoform X2 [Talpa occidentalis]|uniref:proteoglycan 4-like isoform X2 n=1 Tax=Talpa occidentalis TaxID=50954 RepID=UPI0023F6664E|nr:proteoglycan 4-like isoform X2 [Talpa occidentalis]